MGKARWPAVCVESTEFNYTADVVVVDTCIVVASTIGSNDDYVPHYSST